MMDSLCTIGIRYPEDQPSGRAGHPAPPPRRASRGSILMEFVLTMPILVVFVMLILQIALIGTTRQFVAYSAFCGARSMLAVGPDEASGRNGPYSAARRALAWVTTASDEGADVYVPDWGTIPESASIDERLAVEAGHSDGSYVQCKVEYKMPLVIPIAGAVIGWLFHDSRGVVEKAEASVVPGYSEPSPLIGGLPYMTLTETCVLPLPYSLANLPKNAYDYTDVGGQR